MFLYFLSMLRLIFDPISFSIKQTPLLYLVCRSWRALRSASWPWPCSDRSPAATSHLTSTYGPPHRSLYTMSNANCADGKFTLSFQHVVLLELTGDGETGRAPEKCQVKGVQGFLQCTPVKSDRWTRIKPPHRHGSSGSETTRPGAAGPSGLCAPQRKSSTGSSPPDSLPASECCSKTLLIKGSLWYFTFASCLQANSSDFAHRGHFTLHEKDFSPWENS